MDTLILANFVLFLSTLSLRRATPLTSGTKTIFTNFYPRSPCGERRCLIMLGGFAVDFYPRSPCGERPHPVTVLVCIIEFLSTLSLRRATAGVNSMLTLIQISIHALLAESDCYSLRHSAQGRYFYPRSPCGERHQPVTMHTWRKVFLSTLSLRRATYYLADYGNNVAISIHALLAESDYIRSNVPNFSSISIHALLAESDRPSAILFNGKVYFYPRSPCGERLLLTVVPYGQYKISIHALLAESDISQLQCIHGRKHFYPRSPCGERLFRQNYECFEWIISIHALLAESDGWSLNINGAMKISIHALLAESDRFGGWLIPHNRNFYPRSPCGERPIVYNIVFVPGKFLSTLSLRRATGETT